VKTDHEKVPDQVGVDILGPAAHVLLLKATEPVADGGFDFSSGSHRNLERGATFELNAHADDSGGAGAKGHRHPGDSGRILYPLGSGSPLKPGICLPFPTPASMVSISDVNPDVIPFTV